MASDSVKSAALSVLRAEARKRFLAYKRMPSDGTFPAVRDLFRAWDGYRNVRRQIREVVLMLARTERVAAGPLPPDLGADLLRDAG